MSKKSERQQMIRNILATHQIKKQTEFVRLLEADGIPVTQATVSRDIKDMQLIKVPDPEGGFHYSLPAERKTNSEEKLTLALMTTPIQVIQKDYFLLIKTLPGSAQTLGNLIDKSDFKEVLGTVSGDNTLLVMCKDSKQAKKMKLKLRDF